MQDIITITAITAAVTITDIGAPTPIIIPTLGMGTDMEVIMAAAITVAVTGEIIRTTVHDRTVAEWRTMVMEVLLVELVELSLQVVNAEVLYHLQKMAAASVQTINLQILVRDRGLLCQAVRREVHGMMVGIRHLHQWNVRPVLSVRPEQNDLRKRNVILLLQHQGQERPIPLLRAIIMEEATVAEAVAVRAVAVPQEEEINL